MRSRLARCRSRVRLRVDAFCKKILRYWRFFSSNRDTSHFPPWTGPKWPGPKWPARNSPAQNAQARNGKKLLFFVLQQLSRERCFNYECDPKPKVCRTKKRIECRTEPKEQCKNVVAAEMPRRKRRRPKAKQDKCSQNCQPVFWCKVCQA